MKTSIKESHQEFLQVVIEFEKHFSGFDSKLTRTEL